MKVPDEDTVNVVSAKPTMSGREYCLIYMSLIRDKDTEMNDLLLYLCVIHHSP